MPLTARDRRNLKELIRRTPGNEVVELEDRHVAYWRDMERRGYARVAETARCGAERVRGNFVSITEAGREALMK